MRPTTKWFFWSACLIVGSLIGWHFGLGMWAASWSWYQFNLLLGQGVISMGVAVIIFEIEKHWYDDDDE